jgi:Putative beta-barrel porin-2, OmpL-like. bbp2
MGARVNCRVNDAVALNYWLVNGTHQSEPFNGFKDQFFGLSLQPGRKVSWNINYYLGQEHPDVTYYPNGGGPPDSPTVQGVPFSAHYESTERPHAYL